MRSPTAALRALAGVLLLAPFAVALAAGTPEPTAATPDSKPAAESTPATDSKPAAPVDPRLEAKIADVAAGRKPEVAIPFANHGGIRDWRAVGRDALLVEGTGGRWYRVELLSGCFDLPFAERVGFQANPTGDFDRFSSVYVRGQRCAVKSVTASAPPPKPVKKPKPAAPAGGDGAAKPGDAR